MKKLMKTNGVIAGALITTSVVVPTAAQAETDEQNFYENLEDLMNLMDRLYDSIENDDQAREDIKKARDAFVNADDDTWDQIVSEDVLDLDGVSDEEKKDLILAASEVIYADTFANLQVGIENFRATYNEVYGEAEFSTREMLELIAAIQLDGFSKLEDNKDMLKDLQDQPDKQLKKMINLAYEVALDDIQSTEQYEELAPKVEFDVSDFIGVVLGVKGQMSDEMQDTVTDAQIALLDKGIEVVESTPDPVTVYSVDDNDGSVKGEGAPGNKVTVYVEGDESSKWTGNVDEDGTYEVEIDRQNDGTVLVVTQTDAYGLESTPVTTEVRDANPSSPDPDPDPSPSPGDSSGDDDSEDSDESDESEDQEDSDDTGEEEPEDPSDEDLVEVDPTDDNVLEEGSYTVDRNEDESGNVTVRVQLDGDRIAEAISDKSPEEVNKISVKVNKREDSDIAEVSVPSNAINAVKEKNQDAIVEVITDDASYNLPVSEVDTEALALEFNSSSDDVEVSIQVNEVNDEEVEESVTNNNLNKVSKVIEYKVHARTKDGSQSKEIKRFKQYVERSITGEQDFDMTHSTAVRLNENGTFTAVPTIFDGTKATIKSMSNSKYTVVENDVTFSDIDGTWNEATIEKLASKYIIQGKLDGTYAPKEYIKRSEFTALISRALGLMDEESEFEGMFPDVKEGKWYANHVEAAVEAGIIQGRDNGHFDPDANVTRNETAAMIRRAMDFVTYEKGELNADKNVNEYEDYSQIPKWARDNVQVLLQADIMGGRGNGDFDPHGDINRAEMAKVLDEFLTFVQFMND